MTLAILSALVGFTFATVGLLENKSTAFWMGITLMMPEVFNELTRM